jgi:squalene cyclase
MTPLAFALAALLAQDEPTDSVTAAIVWLARHQRPDGSWGPIPGTCGCFGDAPKPKEIPRDPEVGKKAAPLIDALRSETLDERERAADDLLKLGEAVEPFLEDAAKDKDAEVKSRAESLLRTLRAPRTKGDVEPTALALLTILGAGYSHLSKDTYGTIVLGDTIKRGLQWLMSRQDVSGRIGDGDGVRPPQAIAALVLLEAYGLTGSNLFTEQAQKAHAWLAGEQRKNGSWNDDLETTYWSVIALKSSALADLANEVRRAGLAVDWLKERADKGDAADIAAFVTASCFWAGPDVSAHAAKLALFKASDLDARTRQMTALALWQADGPAGPHWKKWNEGMKDAILKSSPASECGKGGWGKGATSGRTTALNALTLEVYYRYANVVGGKK